MTTLRRMNRLEYLKYWIKFLVSEKLKKSVRFAHWLKGFEDRYSQKEFDEMGLVWTNYEEPVEDGSVWIHRNKNFYRVLFITNMNSGDDPNRREKYPPTVVYENVHNQKKYSGRLDDWHRRMLRLL